MASSGGTSGPGASRRGCTRRIGSTVAIRVEYARISCLGAHATSALRSSWPPGTRGSAGQVAARGASPGARGVRRETRCSTCTVTTRRHANGAGCPRSFATHPTVHGAQLCTEDWCDVLLCPACAGTCGCCQEAARGKGDEEEEEEGEEGEEKKEKKKKTRTSRHACAPVHEVVP